MKIHVSSGRGEGPTPLAAFDAALLDAGVGDHNLICLSSVIPPGSEIIRSQHEPQPEEYGHRMYVVLSQQRVEELGQEAWAGLGWTQSEQTGHGLFVELHGHSDHEVDRAIRATLERMIQNRDRRYGPIRQELCGIECKGPPVCALVVAVYETQSWSEESDRESQAT